MVSFRAKLVDAYFVFDPGVQRHAAALAQPRHNVLNPLDGACAARLKKLPPVAQSGCQRLLQPENGAECGVRS